MTEPEPTARELAAVATVGAHHVRRLLEHLARAEPRAEPLLASVRELILTLHRLVEILDAENHQRLRQMRRGDLRGRGGPDRGGGRPRR